MSQLGGVPTTLSPAGTPLKLGSIFVRGAPLNRPTASSEESPEDLVTRIWFALIVAKKPATIRDPHQIPSTFDRGSRRLSKGGSCAAHAGTASPKIAAAWEQLNRQKSADLPFLAPLSFAVRSVGFGALRLLNAPSGDKSRARALARVAVSNRRTPVRLRRRALCEKPTLLYVVCRHNYL